MKQYCGRNKQAETALTVALNTKAKNNVKAQYAEKQPGKSLQLHDRRERDR